MTLLLAMKILLPLCVDYFPTTVSWWIMTGESHPYLGVAVPRQWCLQPWQVGCPLIRFRNRNSEPKSFALGSLCCTRFMRRSFCPLPLYKLYEGNDDRFLQLCFVEHCSLTPVSWRGDRIKNVVAAMLGATCCSYYCRSEPLFPLFEIKNNLHLIS